MTIRIKREDIPKPPKPSLGKRMIDTFTRYVHVFVLATAILSLISMFGLLGWAIYKEDQLDKKRNAEIEVCRQQTRKETLQCIKNGGADCVNQMVAYCLETHEVDHRDTISE